MNFCNKSQTPNKIPLMILSQKHAHYEHFSSLSFLLFNSCHIIPRLIFVAFNYGVEILAKRTSPPHVIRPLVLWPDFTSIPLTSPIFQSPANTQTKFQPPCPASTSSYPLLYMKWTCPFPRSLFIQIYQK